MKRMQQKIRQTNFEYSYYLLLVFITGGIGKLNLKKSICILNFHILPHTPD